MTSGSDPVSGDPLPVTSECPNTEAICGFVEGRVSDGARESLEQHLDRCAACRRAVVEVGKALEASRSALDRVAGASGEPVSATTDRPEGASRSTAPPSHRLSRYEIRREVAMGGMGVVYEGWDPALGRRVALKLMRPDLKLSATTEQLATEARALAKVSHPNVLTVFDVGIENDAVFLAAEYIEGVTMDKGWPHRARSYRDRIDAYMQAARGVAAIHAAGLTHRDIKPSNILLGNDGRARITDFGLAVRDGQQAAPAGTPAYMAPEQLKGEASPAADQFGLAVCLAEALLGERFSAGADADQFEKKARGAWGDDQPPRALWVALATALSADPSRRHADVEVFIRAVEASVHEAGGRQRPRGSNKLAWAGGALVFAAVAGGSAWAIVSRVAPSGALATPTEAAQNSLTVTASATPTVVAFDEMEVPLQQPSDEASAAPPVRASGAPVAGGPRAAGGVAASGLDGPIMPLNDSLTASERMDKYGKLIAEASKAMQAKDGKKCLALMAQARPYEPTAVDGMTTMRASCEMMAGQCDQGAQRLAKDKNLGAAGGAMASQLRATYCPADSAQSSPEERLKAVGFQAGSPPFTAAKCAQYQAQAAKAIKDHGSKKPDSTAVAMANNNVAMCYAWVGDCAKTAALIGGSFPPSDDREERIKKWVRQAHPNCANFGN